MNSPTFSVVITCHNYGRYLDDAIESVYRQIPVGPIQIIVVNDGSTDDTEEIAWKHTGWHRSGFSMGYMPINACNAHEARRVGFRVSLGEFFMFLDADDRLHPSYLLEGWKKLAENPDAVVAFGDLHCFGLRNVKMRFRGGNIEQANYIHCGSLVRREALAACRVMDHPLSDWEKRHSDWWIFRHLLHGGGRAVWSPGIYFYRKHGNSLSDKRQSTHDERYCRDLTPIWELAEA